MSSLGCRCILQEDLICVVLRLEVREVQAVQSLLALGQMCLNRLSQLDAWQPWNVKTAHDGYMQVVLRFFPS